MVIGTYTAGAVLGLIALWLLARTLVGSRRRQQEITLALRRYDNQLASLARALDDVLLEARDAPEAPLVAADIDDPHELEKSLVMQTLELARNRTHAHAAVAAVADPEDAPMLAAVGLSQAEAAQVGRMGLPDYRGARAVLVSFSDETDGTLDEPIRAGLVVPLLDSPGKPGMLAVLTRSPARRFSDADINELERVVLGARPALESTLALVKIAPGREDSLGEASNRGTFQALVEYEMTRAREDSYPLALLMLDVDRLNALNTRIGYDAADEVLVQTGEWLNEVSGRSDLPCEIGGGRFAVLLPRGVALDAKRLFERLCSALGELDVDAVSVSGGIAELNVADDAADLVGRADAALGQAKTAGRGTVVSSTAR